MVNVEGQRPVCATLASGPTGVWRCLNGLVTVVALATALAGCSAANTCPEIGWVNTVVIQLEGAAERVTAVELDSTHEVPSSASPVADDRWEVSTSMTTPPRVSIRALASSGEVLAESTANLTWVRVGGTERCGGPEETEPVTLTVDP